MRISVIIAAAGRSRRFGDRDKLAQDLGGRTLLLRAVEPFTRRDEVGEIIVAGPPEDFDAFRETFGPTLGFHGARVVEGGRAERWETVRNALAAVSADATHIAVHDAARPALRDDLLGRLIEAARSADAVVPGVPVTDTVKRVSMEETRLHAGDDNDASIDAILGGEGRVEVPARAAVETLDRQRLVLVQTPQVFAADLLRRAYAQNDLSDATDDAQLVERLGETVHVVAGDRRNLKVTTPEDVEMVRALLGISGPAERPTHLRF